MEVMMDRKEVLQTLRRFLVTRQTTLRNALDGDLIALREPVHGDIVDATIISVHGAISSQLAEVESHELTAIDMALERWDQGIYGVCEDCAKDISTERLTALPYATRCIECQRKHEKRVGVVNW
jgi:DnaK suppressor protein